MIVSLQTHRLQTLDQVREFVASSGEASFRHTDRASAYAFCRRTLAQFRYRSLGRRDKGSVRAYLAKVTGLSRAQVQRLIRQYLETGRIVDRRGPPKNAFKARFTKADKGLLAEVDAVLEQRCGHATRAVMRRMYEEYGDERFERLATISNGHLYNLRKSKTYRRRRTHYRKTKARKVGIAERRKPQPKGRPGFLRVDTVDQGEKDGKKGVFHINLVDEVTQWEHVGTVRAISERFLLKVLEELIKSCPFKVLGFRADNGSEYINHLVAELLNSLHIPEFTKSRPRRSNDNALVESKNGNVIRRCFGYGHIPKLFDREVNVFSRDVLTPYLNFHRPCLFPTEVVDPKGKTTKHYRYQDTMTPFEKLKSLTDAEQYLKPGITIAALEQQAKAVSDLDAATALNKARDRLFDLIKRESDPPRRRSA
ncbi:MAG: integrase [Acidobacteriota bacterium]|nr:integrase [Acidobacteriota bacterium]